MAHRLQASSGRPVVRILLSLGLVFVLAFGVTAAVRSPEAVGSTALLDASTSGSPFRGSGVRARVTLSVVLAEEVELTVRVLDYDGRTVRKLLDQRPRGPGTYPIAWDGRDAKGRKVADGPYRMRATARAPSGTESVERWVTKAPNAPYPRLPGAIVVAINAGHGGSDTGAIVASLREKTINLDIARRLRRMLEASGIRVVMTRTGDADVNRPAIDRNGDGRKNHIDELIARNDMGNLARADLMLNIHNNATECRCGAGTEMFINRNRPWAAENRRLARAVQDAHVRRLQAFESGTWRVIDRGIGSGDYMSLRPATSKARRPSLMPAILGESLYLDRRRERARLRDHDVRTALAAAYFDGVTGWLATRLHSVRYTDIEAPDRLPAGGNGSVRLRIDNTGNRSSSSWRLEARVVPRVSFYDGSGSAGRLVGSVQLPQGIAPGGTVEVELGITMPTEARRWLLKLDVVRPAGRLSDRGVIQPQLRIVTVTPDPTATPSPAPSEVPSPAPSEVPSPAPSVEPSIAPSLEPSLVPSPAPIEVPSAVPGEVPSPAPSVEPSVQPLVAPAHEATPEPTAEPTHEPTPEPTPEPTAEPTAEPTPTAAVEPGGDPSP